MPDHLKIVKIWFKKPGINGEMICEGVSLTVADLTSLSIEKARA